MNNKIEPSTPSAPIASIVVPVYNGSKYLRECLDSLARQSEQNIEIIIVDDGSSDESYAIASSYSQDPRFIIIRNDRNQGTFRSRLRGMLASRGRYIGSVDADDWVESNFVEILVSLAEREGSDLVQCRISAVFEQKKRRLPWADAGIRTFSGASLAGPAIRADFWHIACNKIFRRHLLEKAAPLYEGIDRNIVVADDKLLMMPIYFYARSMASSKRRLYMYRQRPESATNNRCLAHDIRHVEDTAYVDDQIERLLLLAGATSDLITNFEKSRKAEVRLAIFNATSYPPHSHGREVILQKIIELYGTRAIDPGTHRSVLRHESSTDSGMHSARFQMSEIYAHFIATEFAVHRLIQQHFPVLFAIYDMPRKIAASLFHISRSALRGK